MHTYCNNIARICINMRKYAQHKYAFGGTWGVPPDTPRHAKGARVDFWSIFGHLGVPFWSPWGPFEAQFAPSKAPSRSKETKKWG